MRHSKHKYILGRKTSHRKALMVNLGQSLLLRKRIITTLVKAKALKVFIEKIITKAIKAYKEDDSIKKLHYRRLVVSKIVSKAIVRILFNDIAQHLLSRKGGYTRIYKISKRKSDASKMAIIEIILDKKQSHPTYAIK